MVLCIAVLVISACFYVNFVEKSQTESSKNATAVDMSETRGEEAFPGEKRREIGGRKGFSGRRFGECHGGKVRGGAHARPIDSTHYLYVTSTAAAGYFHYKSK